jgi:hypothetical protein
MIVWGGETTSGTLLSTGGRYDPAAAAGSEWQATDTTDADTPAPRTNHTAVWTGAEMIVWGGNTSTGLSSSGGRYNPAAIAGTEWQATSTTNNPAPRTGHTAVWTGTEMVVWGGTTSLGPASTGGRYDPAGNAWQATDTTDTDTPAPRTGHTAVWTGAEMIVWGGEASGTALSTGGRYDPATNTWTAMSSSGAPSARYGHTAEWTGTHMIVWGGTDGIQRFASGAMYDPVTDAWQDISDSVSDTDTPASRFWHSAVWTGSHMIVWGGDAGGDANTGGRYDTAASADTAWQATSTTGNPAARTNHTAVWTGSEMIVWGGDASGTALSTGGRYTP